MSHVAGRDETNKQAAAAAVFVEQFGVLGINIGIYYYYSTGAAESD